MFHESQTLSPVSLHLQWLFVVSNCQNQLQTAVHHRRQFIQLAAVEKVDEAHVLNLRHKVHDARRSVKIPLVRIITHFLKYGNMLSCRKSRFMCHTISY